MKMDNISKLLGIGLSLLLSFPTAAQVVFEEDFTNGFPFSWERIDVDGNTPSEHTDFVYDAWITTNDLDDANNEVAMSNSWYNPIGQSDDWMITSAIALPANSELSWKNESQDANFVDTYEVRISTTTQTRTGCLQNPVLYSGTGTPAYWSTETIDLDAAGYANQVVYIAFRNRSNNKFIIMIDDITITNTTPPCAVSAASTNGASRCGTGNVSLTATPGSGGTTCKWYTTSSGGSSFYTGTQYTASVSSTTTYYVSSYDGTSCESNTRTAVTATVNPVPNVNASGTATICDGESTTISASGASSYVWNNGGGSGSSVSVSPGSTTTYTVTGTSNNCSDTDQVTVTVNSVPNVNASGTATICDGESTTISASGASSYVWNNGGGSGSSVSVSPGSTTTYTVTGTSNNCSGTDQITVTVNPVPNVNASGTTTICEGESTTISASGASSYVWNNGGGNGSSVSVSPNSTTTYTVTGTSNNCTDTDQVTVTVNSVPNPTINQIGIELSTGPFVAYQWYLDGLPINGASSQSVIPVTNGNYTVQVTDNNGCISTSPAFSFLTVGVQLNEDQLSAKVYPNPTTGAVTVNVDAIADLELVDIWGRVIMKGEGAKRNHSLDLSRLANGIYFVRVSSQNVTSSIKVFKK